MEASLMTVVDLGSRPEYRDMKKNKEEGKAYSNIIKVVGCKVDRQPKIRITLVLEYENNNKEEFA